MFFFRMVNEYGCMLSFFQVLSSENKDSTTSLGGGFKYCLFSPLFGEDFQFD